MIKKVTAIVPSSRFAICIIAVIMFSRQLSSIAFRTFLPTSLVRNVGRNYGILESIEAINAELIAKKERDELVGSRSPTEIMQPLPLSSLQKRLKNGRGLINALLLRDGCVSIKNILCKDTADLLREYVNKEMINSELAVSQGVEYDKRFGAVNNRRMRADMFLPMSEPIVRQAFTEATRQLRPVIDELDGMLATGVLHELSSIISDPGSPTQCMHCDTPWLSSVAPLYTFFIAIQDVEEGMGHTTFIPGSHTQEAHKIFNGPIKQKNELIAASRSVKSNLKIGDVAIFDSRILHAGGANTDSDRRRILFYFTFTSGDVERNNPNPARGSGSIRDEDRMKYSWIEFSR
jgi:hypothetical protein